MLTPSLRRSSPALLLFLGACSGTDGATSADVAAPVAVTTAVAADRSAPESLPLTGELVASEEAHVSADTNGVVTSVRVQRGQHVDKGDVIATVDARAAKLGADAASAQQALAEVQLTEAKSQCARAESLHAQGAMATSQYDLAMAQCKAQTEALQAASANASLAGTSLSKAQVRAPFSGRVGERLVDVGEFVAAAQPVISLYTDEALRVRFSVPERQAGSVAEGQVARFALTSAPDAWRESVVRFVSPALRAPARDLVVEAEVSDVAGLKPGMFARIALEVGQASHVSVPDAAVHTDGSVSSLYVVREGRAFQTVVRKGASAEGYTAVLTDLAVGDVVVVNPPDTLHDGAAVNATAGQAN